MYVRAPGDLSVEALGAIPVMVAWSDENGDRVKSVKRGAKELTCVGRKPLMLVEIASTEHSVYFFGRRQLRDSYQRVSQRLPSLSRRPLTSPPKRSVQMKVREKKNSQATPLAREARPNTTLLRDRRSPAYPLKWGRSCVSPCPQHSYVLQRGERAGADLAENSSPLLLLEWP